MKNLKVSIEKLSLSQETKDRMFDAVIKAGKTPDKKPNMRIIGILSSAAVLVFIALAAVAVSVISNRSDDMIAEPNKNSVSSDRQSEHIVDKKESSSIDDKDHKNDTSKSETSENELENSNFESEVSIVSKPSETVSDPDVSSDSSYQETSVHEESYENIEQSSSTVETSKPIETSDNPQQHIYEPPVKTINVIVPDEVELTEYAGDMYRPEGYNENIASGLALKIENTQDKDMLYSVVIKDTGNDFNKMLTEANAGISKPLETNDFKCITLNGAGTTNRYFALLTKEQFVALAENGVKLSYVGSGTGNLEDMNWTTSEGINTYCELNGDMYVFDGDEIRSYPDLYETVSNADN